MTKYWDDSPEMTSPKDEARDGFQFEKNEKNWKNEKCKTRIGKTGENLRINMNKPV